VGLLAALAAIGSSMAAQRESAATETLAPPAEPPVTERPPVALGVAAVLDQTWSRLTLTDEPAGPPAVTHGEAGWLVVMGGPRPMIGVSGDGRAWEVSSLPAGASYRPQALISGERMIVTFSSAHPGEIASGWVSNDRGRTWQPADLPDDRVVVTALAEAAGAVYATGTVLAPGADYPGGSGAVWRLDGRSWRRLVEPDGVVAGVVEREGEAFVVGGDPAGMWRIAGDRLVAEQGAAGSWEVLSVAPDPAGGWKAMVGVRGLWVSLVHSDDLVGWSDVPDSTMTWSDQRLERVADSLVVLSAAHRPLLLEPERVVVGTPYGTAFTDLAVAEGVAVGVGSAPSGRSGLWVAGVADPVVRPRPVGAAGWVEVAATPVAGSPGPPAAFPTVDGFVVQAAPGLVGYTPDGVVVTSGSTRAPILRAGSGEWFLAENGRLREPGVVSAFFDATIEPWAVTRTGDEWLVVGLGGSQVWSGREGSWAEIPAGAPSPLIEAVGVRGGIVGRAESGEVWFTSDGRRWDPVEGAPAWPAADSDLYMVLGGGGRGMTRIGFGAPWPEMVELEVPAPPGFGLYLHRGQVRVMAGNEVLVSANRGATWERVPFGVEDGVAGRVTLLPTDQLMAAAVHDGRVTILRYEP
jgi:hypothetical protein